MKYLILSLFFLFKAQEHASATCDSIIYVKHDAAGFLNDGSSWTTAYLDLQSALDEASACPDIQEIWVAGGTYRPTVDIAGGNNTGTQNLLFNVYFEVELYGGFCGWENDRGERIKYLCTTILSGDHNEDDVLIDDKDHIDFPFSNASDNSYNIMKMKNLTTATILDGFIFMGGNAFKPTTLSNRIGGAIFNDGRGLNDLSNPRISNCIFQYNKSRLGGGAVYNYGENGDASPEFINCEFKFNYSQEEGGAVYNLGVGDNGKAGQVFKNCIFYSNRSDAKGGAVYSQLDNNANDTPFFDACTIVENHAPSVGGIMTSGTSAKDSIDIINTVFYRNTQGSSIGDLDFNSDVTPYNIVYSHFNQGGASGTNSSGDPLFLSNSNLRLQQTSPLINAGKPPGPPITGGNGTVSLDLDANARLMGGRQDIGAYEFLSCPLSNIIYVNDDQYLSTPTGESLNFALRSLNAALEMACHCPEKPTVLVSEGTYIPDRLDSMEFALFESRRHNIFSLDCPVNLFGGQPNSVLGSSTENSVIDGDILQNDNSSVNPTKDDNIRTLLYLDQEASASLISRFTLKNGVNGIDFLNPSPYSASAIELNIVELGNFSLDIIDCEFRRNINSQGATVKINSQNAISQIRFESCEFRSNDASNGSALSFSGSSNSASQLKLKDCIIQGNDAIFDFGGQKSSPLVFRTASSIGDQLHMSNCEFEENEGSQEGGAMSVHLLGNGSHILDINECEFNDNDAGRAGAISLNDQGTSKIKIRNSLFVVNRATNDGGGALVVDVEHGSDCVISNCVFANNRCSPSGAGINGGGAILLEGAAAKIVNSTFINNNSSNGDGGAVFNTSDGMATIYNSLFWSNESNQETVNSVECINGSNLELDHCLIEEESCQQSHMTDVSCVSTLFNEDPLINFDPGLRKYSVEVFSPAIGAGNNDVVEEVYDFVGSRYDPAVGSSYRIKFNVVDIGAFEHPGLCNDISILNSMNDFYLGGELKGAWTARLKFKIQGEFSTSEALPLILDAPEVQFEGAFNVISGSTLEIRSNGCN